MQVDNKKILEEAARYQSFLAGGDTGLTEDELKRQERYHHAMDLIKKYDVASKIAKNVHRDRFPGLSKGSVERDFFIAYHLLGKEGLFNKDSSRNWALYKCMEGIALAFKQENPKEISKLLLAWYKLSDLDKKDVELPDFSNINLPELRVHVHPEALKMKNDLRLTEELIARFLKPKNKQIEDAQIVKDDGHKGSTV